MKHKLKLSIAGNVIELSSPYPCLELLVGLERSDHFKTYRRFVYRGERPPSIAIDVDIVKARMACPGGTPFFISKHPDGSENWRLYRRANGYVFWSSSQEKLLIAFNAGFDRIQAKVSRCGITSDFDLFHGFKVKHDGMIWCVSNIVYNFIQVLLINYLAYKDKGIIAHAAGINAGKGNGLIFCGESGAGKSTSAELWSRAYGAAGILNDDRVIVARSRQGFIMHSSPWVGSFQEYEPSPRDPAPLKKVFFIYHAKRNTCSRIHRTEAFNYFFPVIFPPFWDKQLLAKTSRFILDLAGRVPCYRLGFVKGRSAVDFVKGID